MCFRCRGIEDVGEEDWLARGGVCPSGSINDNESTQKPTFGRFHGWIRNGTGEEGARQGCTAGAVSERELGGFEGPGWKEGYVPSCAEHFEYPRLAKRKRGLRP